MAFGSDLTLLSSAKTMAGLSSLNLLNCKNAKINETTAIKRAIELATNEILFLVEYLK